MLRQGVACISPIRRRMRASVRLASSTRRRHVKSTELISGEIMKLLFSRRYAFALVALAVATSVGCCCTRKGLVLRGDWSLELNRVPHMRRMARLTTPIARRQAARHALQEVALAAIAEFRGRSRVRRNRRRRWPLLQCTVIVGSEAEHRSLLRRRGRITAMPTPAARTTYSMIPRHRPSRVSIPCRPGRCLNRSRSRITRQWALRRRRKPSDCRRPSALTNVARRHQYRTATGSGRSRGCRCAAIGVRARGARATCRRVRQVSHVEMVEGPSAAGDEPSQGVEAATSGPELSVPTSGKNSVTWKVARRRT